MPFTRAGIRIGMRTVTLEILRWMDLRLSPLMIDEFYNHLFQTVLRRVIDRRFESGKVGHAPADVLEIDIVRLGIALKFDLGTRPCRSNDKLSQFQD